MIGTIDDSAVMVVGLAGLTVCFIPTLCRLLGHGAKKVHVRRLDVDPAEQKRLDGIRLDALLELVQVNTKLRNRLDALGDRVDALQSKAACWDAWQARVRNCRMKQRAILTARRVGGRPA